MSARSPIRLKIPVPCSQDWQSMDPSEQGGFCHRCNRHVTDFTGLSDKEILLAVEAAKDKICGRFTPDQLDRPLYGAPSPKHHLLPNLLLGALLFTGLKVSADARSVSKTTWIAAGKPVKPGTGAPARQEIAVDTARQIQGTVTDSMRKTPLPGAMIRIKGTSTGTVADSEGRFVLQIPDSLRDEPFTLVFTEIGFVTRERNIPTGLHPADLKIDLPMSTVFLGEMVILRKPSLWTRIRNLFRP